MFFLFQKSLERQKGGRMAVLKFVSWPSVLPSFVQINK